MSESVAEMKRAPEYNYHLLRGALESFQKNVAELTETQYQKARSVADKTYALESIVLSAPEASGIVIPENKLESAVAEIASRYPDRETFLLDLESNNLNEDVLRHSLHRELLFDAVLDRVTARSPDISDLDVQLFYQLHLDRFKKPEKRKARHILITINNEFAENTRDVAYEKAQSIYNKLMKNPAKFESLAKKNSECPTALEGGVLGELNAGVLYPELDTVLFSMDEGEISAIIESEIGFHILLCEKIYKSITVPLSKARPRIKQVLDERQRKACQKAWLEGLQEKSNDN